MEHVTSRSKSFISGQHCQRVVLSSTLVRLRLWKQYVDDTKCIARKSSFEVLLEHLNSMGPTIQFTMAMEKYRGTGRVGKGEVVVVDVQRKGLEVLMLMHQHPQLGH